MSFDVWRRAVACAVAGLLLVGGTARAQEPAGVDATRELETRASLEAEAKAAEAAHRTGEAFLLRSRLQKGDFQDGDRIVISLLGIIPFNDTLTVRAGKMLQLPKFAEPLSLDGVLRSELTGRISSYLAQFLKDSSVRVTPLLRLGVMGEIGRQGYYYTSADVLLNDIIMKAGGPAPSSDLNNVVVRRGGEIIWNAKDTQVALSDGISLDRLHLRAGDEVIIGAKSPPFNWMSVLQIASTVAGVLFAFVSLRGKL
ncbi:MAG: hypothetical protein JWM95_4340 [Gemmatimonadetes bacterium]|nr:hypothetical protein [Gemmatimonadota bacterium]